MKIGMDDLIIRDGSGRMRDLLRIAATIDGTVDEIYATWLISYAATCATAKVDPVPIAADIIAKGFFDKSNGATRRRITTEIAHVFPALLAAIDACVQERLATEFKDAAAPEHGGENLAVGRHIRAPGFADNLRIDALQDDIAWCFASGSDHCSRPFPRRLLELAPRVPAGAQNGAQGGRPPGPSVTDITNAFLAQPQFVQNGICLLRHLRGQWYLYDKQCYRTIQERDVSGMVMRFLRRHPLYSGHGTTKMMIDVMNQLKAHDAAGLPSTVQPPVWLTPDGLPIPAPDWLTCRNALVNLGGIVRALQGEAVDDVDMVQPLTPRLFSTFAVGYDFNPQATCPKFEKFLLEVLPQLEARESAQMMAGLCLVADTSYNVFFILLGPAGTAKSTFLSIFVAMLGEYNICHVPFSKFSEKFSVGLLTEKLVNIIGEGDTELPRDVGLGRVEGLLKDITDGGILPVERKYGEPGNARATARCVAAANALPAFYDRSEAIWDRLRIVPFEVRVRGTAHENPHLRNEIVTEELPGIFLWALQGLAKLRGLSRFPETARGLALKTEHRAACDHEREFLQDNFIPDAAATPTLRQTVYAEYRSWMATRNYHPVGESKFAQNVVRVFPGVVSTRARDAAGRQPHVWVGMRRLGGVAA